MSTDLESNESIECPRCTILNNINNDECYICRLSFKQKEGERANNDDDRKQRVIYVRDTKTDNKSLLESIWGYFILIIYTSYTIVITWTSETIIKIIAYFILLLVLYFTYYISPSIIKIIISTIKTVKNLVISIIKNIFEVRTNPLVWILLTVVITWCVVNTLGINAISFDINCIKDRVNNLEFDVKNLQIDVNYLKSVVNKLKDRVNNIEIGLNDFEFRVETGFKKLGDTIKTIDDQMTWITNKMNESYTPWIEDGGWLKSTDSFVRETMYNIFSKLSSKPLTRKEFGLGCFIKGTKIQIDELGNKYINVEQLRNGDYVFSPILNKKIKIKTFIYGNETGYIYKIITNDSLSVTVTETHPMKICKIININNNNNNLFDCNNNIDAQNIYKGNWTQTINGYQQIIYIQKIYVENIMVYNFMLDVVDNTLITYRAIIANGIYSLDLFSQKQHH